MGLWSKMKESQAKAAEELAGMAHYGVHSVRKGVYDYLPTGKMKSVQKPIEGAEAIFDSGADKSRPTITRIGAGAIIAGPTGAIVGALFKKDTSKDYATVIFADGDTAIIEAPRKDEAKLRKFVADVNRLSR